jgi:hypothetical protein
MPSAARPDTRPTLNLGSKYRPSTAEARRQRARAEQSAAEVEQGHRDAAAARKRRRREDAMKGYGRIMREARQREQAGVGLTNFNAKKIAPTE